MIYFLKIFFFYHSSFGQTRIPPCVQRWSTGRNSSTKYCVRHRITNAVWGAGDTHPAEDFIRPIVQCSPAWGGASGVAWVWLVIWRLRTRIHSTGIYIAVKILHVIAWPVKFYHQLHLVQLKVVCDRNG